ncbi:MAG TPA: hypothetical protein VFL80_06260 [Thermoanaerobaculia bacterium]|nr:hypothetical protein [Thermoanaerobaculia bacterium]
MVAVALLTTAVVGLPVALLLNRQLRGGALAGTAFLLGTGVVYGVLLMMAVAGVQWSLPAVAAALILIAGASLLAVSRRKRDLTPGALPFRFHPIDAATVAVIGAHFAFATIAPVWEWDFWAIWGLKGRVFYEARSVDWRFLGSPWNDFAHPDYPLLLPLNLTHAALWSAGWDDRWLGAFTAACALAIVLIVRWLTAEECSPVVSAAIGFVAASLGSSEHVGLAEGPLIALGTGGLLFIRRHLHGNDDGSLRAGAVLLGLAASTKNEGIALIVSAVLALLLFSRNRKEIVRLWPAAAILMPWIVLRMAHGLRGEFGAFVIDRFVNRLGAADAIAASLLQSLAQPFLWIALLVGLICVPAARRVRERFLLAVVAFQLLAYVAAYFVTPRDVMWHIATSWSRLTSHLLLPFALATLLALAQRRQGEEDRAHGEA